jgi:BirA family transcriptional regulator, biotin operon repressor / biotin---[acetyl-CoA-carboxylase] ligase
VGGESPPLPDFFRLVALDETGSTNDDAAAAARGGAPEGTLIWARRQTRGRGRRGRAWVSLEGNLHLSIVLHPDVPPMRAGEIAFVAALAAADTCAGLALAADVRCKWPNDILVSGRKVGGLLIESSIAGNRIEWLVVGIGLNLAAHPDDVEFPATHLSLHAGRTVAVEEGLARFAETFAVRYRLWRDHGFAPVLTAWLDRAAGLGGLIRVRLENSELTGTFDGIAADGAFALTLADGTTRRITAGDVFLPDAVSSGASSG